MSSKPITEVKTPSPALPHPTIALPDGKASGWVAVVIKEGDISYLTGSACWESGGYGTGGNLCTILSDGFKLMLFRTVLEGLGYKITEIDGSGDYSPEDIVVYTNYPMSKYNALRCEYPFPFPLESRPRVCTCGQHLVRT